MNNNIPDWVVVGFFLRQQQTTIMAVTAHRMTTPILPATAPNTGKLRPRILKCWSLSAQRDVVVSSVLSPQWLTPSHSKSVEIQKSFWAHRKSRQTNSAKKRISPELKKKTFKINEIKWDLLLSLNAVTTRWNPLVSVPQPSVTYLSVTKLVRVVIVPTLWRVCRHDRSA